MTLERKECDQALIDNHYLTERPGTIFFNKKNSRDFVIIWKDDGILTYLSSASFLDNYYNYYESDSDILTEGKIIRTDDEASDQARNAILYAAKYAQKYLNLSDPFYWNTITFSDEKFALKYFGISSYPGKHLFKENKKFDYIIYFQENLYGENLKIALKCNDTFLSLPFLDNTKKLMLSSKVSDVTKLIEACCNKMDKELQIIFQLDNLALSLPFDDKKYIKYYGGVSCWGDARALLEKDKENANRLLVICDISDLNAKNLHVITKLNGYVYSRMTNIKCDFTENSLQEIVACIKKEADKFEQDNNKKRKSNDISQDFQEEPPSECAPKKMCL